MELMNNKYFIFDDIKLSDGNTVKNITSLNTLPDIPSKYSGSDYVLSYKVEDNRLLESISFELYESTDYWDILLMLNGMRSMNELPVDYDTVLLRAKSNIDDWIDKGRLLSSSLTDGDIELKYKELLEEEIQKNEKYRYIKYISIGDLSELEAELNNNRNNVKIESELIIG